MFFIGLQQLDDIKTKILQTKFNGGYIAVEKIPPSNSVIISNIDETKRTKEYLDLYFSNPKICEVSGFDHIDLLDNGQVIVHFEDSRCKLTAITCYCLSWMDTIAPYIMCMNVMDYVCAQNSCPKYKLFYI